MWGAFAPGASLKAGALWGNAGAALLSNGIGQVLGNIARTGDASLYGATSNINIPTLLLSPLIGAVSTASVAVGTVFGASELLTGGLTAVGGGYVESLLGDTGNVNVGRACNFKSNY